MRNADKHSNDYRRLWKFSVQIIYSFEIASLADIMDMNLAISQLL